jgi:hypothetical protein
LWLPALRGPGALLFPDRRPALTTVDESIRSDFRSISAAREGFLDDLVIRHPESLSEFYLANADIEPTLASVARESALIVADEFVFVPTVAPVGACVARPSPFAVPSVE